MTDEKIPNTDPRMTFDTFVVGPANRLASAAARRAAESPGTSFNPLFLYAASGLGKSHILSAIAHHSARVHPENAVAYQTLEGYLDELTLALEKGGQAAMRDRYADLTVLLLDDVQFLTGQRQAQEILLRTLDALTGRGAQVVLASDRPPAEINGLDARLLSRFSGGLIVDMGSPDYETRVAILQRKAGERGSRLAEGTAEAMARFPFRNVRELQGALNRVLAIQDMEGRPVSSEEIPVILTEADDSDEGALPEGSPAAAATLPPEVDEPRWRTEIRATVRAAEAEGFEANRIAKLLERADEPADWGDALERFRAAIRRAGEISSELRTLGNPWPEAAATLLRDPERLEEAEHLLSSARERARPFAPLPDGPRLNELGPSYPALAVGAADRILKGERPDYSPLYLHSREAERARRFVEAVGRTHVERNPSGRVGLTSVKEFSQDFIRAISEGVAGAWRERWWSVDVLLLHGVEDLSATERAQEEFFHLFEALTRRSAWIFLASDRPPTKIAKVEERLRSRFEGGLVVELGKGGAAAPTGAAAPKPSTEVKGKGSVEKAKSAASQSAPPSGKEPEAAAAVAPAGVEAGGDGGSDSWFPPPDKVVWTWPVREDRIVEGAD
jgi:chromosomal replication initiation ATPase DnaA